MVQTILKGVFLSGLLFLLARAAAAQTPSAACPPSERSVHTIMVGSVTGCPFSAVMEITQTQALADGTHIQKKSKELVYRDSSGRIRYEHYSFASVDKEIPQSPTTIQIYDPVAGFTYWLTPSNAVAARGRIATPAANHKSERAATGITCQEFSPSPSR